MPWDPATVATQRGADGSDPSIAKILAPEALKLNHRLNEGDMLRLYNILHTHATGECALLHARTV